MTTQIERCCKCGKLVMPWNKSSISFSAIHIKCHQAVLDEVPPEQVGLYAMEILRFEAMTGIRSNVKIRR